MATQTLDQRIHINPDICGGKPRIAVHRITVQNIAIWHERMSLSADEVAARYAATISSMLMCMRHWLITLQIVIKLTKIYRKVKY